MQRKGRQIYLWRLNGYVCGTDRLEADHSHLWNENLQSPDRAERFGGAPQWSVLTENVRGLPPQEGADKNQPGCASTVLWEPPQLHYHQHSSAYRTDPGNKPALPLQRYISFTLKLHQHPHSCIHSHWKAFFFYKYWHLRDVFFVRFLSLIW